MKHDHVTLETPEQVEVQLELAGIAARGIACLIDTGVQGLIVVTTLVGLGLLGVLEQRDVSEGWNALREGGMSSSQVPLVMMAIIGVVTFAVFWGYHVFFEQVSSGRTPGKRLMGLRVLNEAGTPVTFTESLVRNLVRVIDFLPIYYGFGLVGMLSNRHAKRLGDVAAGTIVVRERPGTHRPGFAGSTSGRGPVRLEPRLDALISAFLERRDRLVPSRREQLARRLALPLQKRFGGAGLEPEIFLERLLDAHRHGTVPSWLAAGVAAPTQAGFDWAEEPAGSRGSERPGKPPEDR